MHRYACECPISQDDKEHILHHARSPFFEENRYAPLQQLAPSKTISGFNLLMISVSLAKEAIETFELGRGHTLTEFSKAEFPPKYSIGRGTTAANTCEAVQRCREMCAREPEQEAAQLCTLLGHQPYWYQMFKAKERKHQIDPARARLKAPMRTFKVDIYIYTYYVGVVVEIHHFY